MLLAFTVVLSIGVAGGSEAAELPKPPPLDYRDPAHWVCRSGPATACGDNLATTVLLPNGSTRLEMFKPASAPKADCFYVYPTVSLSPGLTAAPVVTEAERRAVREQAERLTSVCRLFAPLYRQLTVASMMPAFPEATKVQDKAAWDLAEGDVLAAWDHYVAKDNHGRPIVLIGHSQGASALIELIKKRIEGRPIGQRLVSAILPGAYVMVPKGKAVGGTFQSIPPCVSAGQTGCVIAFNTVRANRPLPSSMQLPAGGMQQVCTNPASLSGGAGTLKPYLSATGETIIPRLSTAQPPWTDNGARIVTPFVTTPGLYTGRCLSDEHGALLRIGLKRRAGDHRTGALTGDWVVDGRVEPTMGLHLIDLNLTAGNLIDVLRLQIAAMPDHDHL